MQIGNITDLIANISLAWLSSLCLFWSMSLIMVGDIVHKKSVKLFGWSLILTSFYFGTISLSTGVMVDYIFDGAVSLARWLIFFDVLFKTILTGWYLLRRKTQGKRIVGK